MNKQSSIIESAVEFNLKKPLPPLAEQKRIVERLDQILAVCDEMK